MVYLFSLPVSYLEKKKLGGWEDREDLEGVGGKNHNQNILYDIFFNKNKSINKKKHYIC